MAATIDTHERGAAAPPLPHFFELRAPAEWRAIDFVSDLHLQASHPRTLAAFAAHLRHTPADAVFILGDLIEAWVGDDSRHEGFEAELAEVLRDGATRRSLAFMVGNRDFLIGAEFLKACGVMALADPTVLVAFGQRVLLSHGDALCLEDVEYQRFRAQVRNPLAQQAFLARPLAERRAVAAQMRAVSVGKKHDARPELWADVDTGTAVQWMHAAGAPVLVHGHTHRPGDEDLAPGYLRMVLSDWDLDSAGPPRAEVLRLSLRGLERLPPAADPAAP